MNAADAMSRLDGRFGGPDCPVKVPLTDVCVEGVLGVVLLGTPCLGLELGVCAGCGGLETGGLTVGACDVPAGFLERSIRQVTHPQVGG